MTLRVETPEFLQAWERIKECHESYRDEDGPIHLRLLGQSGLGKSFILKEYRDSFPVQENDGRPHCPVVLVAIPSVPTVRALYVAFLESLGVHGARGSAIELRHRVRVLCKKCGVELIIIDELNHLTDRGQIRTRESVGDALKELLDSMNLPVILSGAARSDVIFQTNIQLRSRVMAANTLRPFDLEERFEELRGFIGGLASGRLNRSLTKWITSNEITTRMFFATDGIHRTVAGYLSLVVKAHTVKGRTIDLPLLAEYFVKYIWEDSPKALNPFGDTFPVRRLCEPGEPFCPTELDGDNHLGKMAGRSIGGSGHAT
jgi:hypothetical protein